MEAKRWTLGVVLATAVSLVGLVVADASPFSSYILADDLGNIVRASAPEASEWESDTGTDEGLDSSGSDGAGSDSSGSDGAGSDSSGAGSDSGGKSNNGHGNNADGVDSSNPGQGKGGPNGEADASCDGTGACVDDEISNGNGSTTTDTTTDTTTSNGNGKSNGKSNGKKK